MLIYHLTAVEDWEKQRTEPVYGHSSLQTEGFIHASTKAQLVRTVGKFFSGAENLCLLTIEPSKAGKIVFEDGLGEGLSFPHIYNPIPKTALVGSRYFDRAEDLLVYLERPATLIHRILDLAAVPSFSSFEERLHPHVKHMLGEVEQIEIRRVPHRNLLIRRPGGRGKPVVVLSAHLDKINHFGADEPEVVPQFEWTQEIEGLLDDSAGLGTVISLFLDKELEDIDLVLALSEMEEGTGLRLHPKLLRNDGKGLTHGMGAQSLGKVLLEEEPDLKGVLVIDTTPFFKGKPGMALYTNHWELNRQQATGSLSRNTEAFWTFLKEESPDLQRLNNTNDYLEYGKLMVEKGLSVPCAALEPAIFPYHRADEKVFKSDLEKVFELGKKAVRKLAFG